MQVGTENDNNHKELLKNVDGKVMFRYII